MNKFTITYDLDANTITVESTYGPEMAEYDNDERERYDEYETALRSYAKHHRALKPTITRNGPTSVSIKIDSDQSVCDGVIQAIIGTHDYGS